MRHHKMIPGAVTVAMATLSVLYFFFYPVRELIAASLIFGVAFGTVWMALLFLFVIQRAALKGVTHLEQLVASARVHQTRTGHRSRTILAK